MALPHPTAPSKGQGIEEGGQVSLCIMYAKHTGAVLMMRAKLHQVANGLCSVLPICIACFSILASVKKNGTFTT